MGNNYLHRKWVMRIILFILLLGAAYSAATGGGLSAFAAIVAMGAGVAVFMLAIIAWHSYNLRCHGAEVRRLLGQARCGGA